MNNWDLIHQSVKETLKPPPRFTVSEWADANRKLSPESSAEPGQWNTARAEYQRGMMNAINDPNITSIVFMTSAQIGKTEIVNCIVGYFIDFDPCPLLVLQPTLEMGQAWSKDRLSPMIRDTPCLKNKVSDQKAKKTGNTLLHKTFTGGHITIAGANSPAGLASRPIRIVLCDEVDRYPARAGTEGDPVNLAKKRTATFWNRKIILTSTPTIKDASRIETAFLQSDQRFYYVPCPDCDEFQILNWKHVQWIDGDAKTAKYCCVHCGTLWSDAKRYAAISLGHWEASESFNGTAGFHLSELYSPWRKLSDIVQDFLHAKDNPELLKTFVNTSLGETWEDQGEQNDPELLMSRAEDYDEIPNQVTCLSAGVDIQQDRIEMEVVGWGDNMESWTIDYLILDGDTIQNEVWDDLLSAIHYEYDHASGYKMPISSVVIDSGFLSKRVFEFIRNSKLSYVRAGKGISGKRSLVEDSSRRAKRLRKMRQKDGKPELIGVDEAKLVLQRQLEITQPGPGYCHFKKDRDAEWYAQLTAEKCVTRYQKGFAIREWIKTRPRNEALDCRVYAIAAFLLMSVARSVTRPSVPNMPEKPSAAKKPKRSSLLL